MRRRVSFVRTALVAFLLGQLAWWFGAPVALAEISSGSLSLSTPAVSASSVSYTFTFSSFNTITAIKCVKTTFSTAIGGTTLPTGMSIASAAMGSGSTLLTSSSWGAATITNGEAKWTYVTGETPGTAGAKTLVVTTITNGSTAGTTYYGRLATFSDTGCTSSLNTGDVTFVFTAGVALSATVNPSLTFTLSGSSCSLGTLSASSTATCTHTMTAATNGASGYTISYLSTTTLTNAASNTIAATGTTGAASATGSEQFGLNLKANTTPSIGADPSGGSGIASANYNTANTFSFTTAGAQVASSSGPSANTVYTASYIANITGSTKPGTYTTTLTYTIVSTY